MRSFFITFFLSIIFDSNLFIIYNEPGESKVTDDISSPYYELMSDDNAVYTHNSDNHPPSA